MELGSESSLAVIPVRANILCNLASKNQFQGPLFRAQGSLGALLLLRLSELPNIFTKPAWGAQAQLQEDFMGRAATLWPNSKPTMEQRKPRLRKEGLGQQVKSVSGRTPAGGRLAF